MSQKLSCPVGIITIEYESPDFQIGGKTTVPIGRIVW